MSANGSNSRRRDRPTDPNRCLRAPSTADCNRARYTALSVGYNIPVAIFGGFAPFIATWLIQSTGNPLSPAFYVIAASLVTLVTMIWVRETAFEPRQ